MKRREVIRRGVLAALAGATGCGGLARPGFGATAGNGSAPRVPVRNIIFYAYDGFNYEDLALARYYAERKGLGPLEIERAMGAGATGSMLSHSLTSVVTDSAAATTAWSVGRKVVNGFLSMYPDGRGLTTILELARQAGRATGLITTTRITHATPAGWIAKVPDRGMEDEIAEQYLAFAPDVLLGGGQRHFLASRRADGRDLVAGFEAAGYDVLLTRDRLAGARGRRTLGIFTDDHLPFEIDRRFQGAEGPSLAEITGKGLELLDRHGDGFVVQVEAGRIDHANHGNDAAACLWDILAADEALGVIREFVDRTPGTLLIMASDHATGGLAVYGSGPLYRRSTAALETLAGFRASHSHLAREFMTRGATQLSVPAVVREHLGIELGPEQVEQVVRILHRDLRVGHPNAHASEPWNSFQQIITRSVTGEADRPNVNYATGAHTAGLVPVFAYGAWDGPANLGVVDNTELFRWMTRALGVDFQNPEMTEAEALEALEALEVGGLMPEREMAVM